MSSAPIDAKPVLGRPSAPPATKGFRTPRAFSARILKTEGFRLAAIYAALFVVSFALFTALVYYTVDAAFRAEALRTADSNLASVAAGYEALGLREAEEVIDQSMAAPAASDYFLLQRNGQKLRGNLPAMMPASGVLTLHIDHHWMLGRIRFLSPSLFVFAGRDLAIMRATEESILRTLAWIFAGALLAAAAGGVLMSRSFLNRMDDITRTCRAIMEGRMADRISLRGNGDELDRLGGAINDMLDRIAALMENLRQVSNDIAHDLRTPLTRLRNRLERAGGGARNEAEYAAALSGAMAETDEILGLFSALLRIAQIESGSRRAGFAPVDLEALVLHVAEIYRPVAEDSGHEFSVAMASQPAIQGDRELLIQLLANLIENAIRHTPSGTPIALQLTAAKGAALLAVSDKGPGIAPEQRQTLFRRFTRLEQSRTTPGNGLGLALVAAIADLHGASVTIEDNHPGTRVEVRF